MPEAVPSSPGGGPHGVLDPSPISQNPQVSCSALPCRCGPEASASRQLLFEPGWEFPKAPGPSTSLVGKVPKGLRAKPKPVFQAQTTFPYIRESQAPSFPGLAYSFFSTRTVSLTQRTAS